MTVAEIKQKVRYWWTELGMRERRIVVVGGVCLISFLFYQLYWSPMMSHVDKMRASIKSKSHTLSVMQSIDKQIKLLESDRIDKAEDVTPVMLLGRVQKLSRKYGVSKPLKTIKQVGETAIELNFEAVDFDKLAAMLTAIVKTYPVSIDQFTATSLKVPGLVNAQLTINLA